MNPTVAVIDPTAPPPQPPQPPRSSFSCDRHPDEKFSGFCPSCLFERLTVLDKSSSNTPSSSRRPSSASATAAAIKSLFSSSSSKPSANNNFFPPPPPPKSSKPSSLPALRRTKSFSVSKNEALGFPLEPQRKSCDVRGRNTLWSLIFLNNDENNPVDQEPDNKDTLKDHENIEAGGLVHDDDDEENEILPAQDPSLENLKSKSDREVKMVDIVDAHVLNMKDEKGAVIQEKKSFGRGFWAAAPFFGKKWHEWRCKQRIKKQNNGEKFVTLPVEKPISRQFMETQSEVAEYEFGRRSCDIGPRFSLDVGRVSFDDPRYSFDEPRASWDGHMIGRSFSRMAPMVSLMEDSPPVPKARPDMQILVEEPPALATDRADEDEVVPGGPVKTREYYTECLSKGRKSLDRSSSMRKMDAVTAADIECNTLPLPINGTKVLERERDSRDDCSESFELRNRSRDSIFMDNSMIEKWEEVKESKKSRWAWRLWGFIRGSGRNKDDDDARGRRMNGSERSLSESWRELKREGYGNTRAGLNGKVFRSHSSVSWRNSDQFLGSFGKASGNGHQKKDEFVLEKNKSARYFPNHIDDGQCRFYLASMSGRRGGINFNPNNSHSVARSVLRLY